MKAASILSFFSLKVLCPMNKNVPEKQLMLKNNNNKNYSFVKKKDDV